MVLVLVAGMALLAGCFGPVERPVADFAVCPDGEVGALDFRFISTSTPVPGRPIESVRWEFDDTSSVETSATVVTHRFAEEGTYYITLTVTDSCGVCGTVTRPMQVSLAAEVYPNWRLTLGWPIRVTGLVANRAEVRLETVVVKAKFYDIDGIRLADGVTVLKDLDPGETVSYTIEASEYHAGIFYATVEVDSFVADCGNPWGYVDDGSK
jgi:hypothetical protein